MQQNRPYLVVAQSGRALAASAARANIKTHVIDRFTDVDTQCYALSTRRISGNVTGLDTGELLSALDEYADKSLAGVVIGSGLESKFEMLDIIGKRIPLLGNQGECVRFCKDPVLLFGLLDALGIPHPETRISSAGCPGDWLVKIAGATGGQHISSVRNLKEQSQGQYFQEHISGKSISVVFIANGKQAQVIGLNETWARAPKDHDFSYSGAVTLPDLEKHFVRTIERIVTILVKQLGLAGLCGVDIIIDANGECNVLEINPRPPATFELHEQGTSLFYAHVMACSGQLISLPQADMKFRGHEIVFAPVEFTVPVSVWPEWVADRPHYNYRIASDAPICTITAAANSTEEVRFLLEQRKASVYELLGLQRIAA